MRSHRLALIVAIAMAAVVVMVVTLVVVARTTDDGSVPPSVISASGRTVRATASPLAREPGADNLALSSKQLGSAFDIEPATVRPKLRVSFRVTKGDLEPIDGAKPSTANLFIAVWEPALHMWAPLPTVYTPETRTISAVAPHFSDFAKRIVTHAGHDAARLTRWGVSTVAAGVSGIDSAIVDASQHLVSAVKSQFFPPAEDDGCATHADRSYSLDAELSSLSGCLLSGDRSPVALRNDGHVPLGVSGNDGTLLTAPWTQSTSFTEAIGAWSQYIHGDAYVAPKGATEIPLSATAKSGYWTTDVHYIYPLMLFMVALGVLGVIPVAKAEAEVVFELRTQIFAASVDLTTLETSIRQFSVSAKVNANDAAEGAGLLVDALSCALGTASAALKQDTKVSKLIDAGISCAKVAISRSGRENLEAVTNVVSGIPDAIKADLGFGDSLRGLVNGANDSQVRLKPTTPLAATPGGRITVPTAACLEAEDGFNGPYVEDPVVNEIPMPSTYALPINSLAPADGTVAYTAVASPQGQATRVFLLGAAGDTCRTYRIDSNLVFSLMDRTGKEVISAEYGHSTTGDPLRYCEYFPQLVPLVRQTLPDDRSTRCSATQATGYSGFVLGTSPESVQTAVLASKQGTPAGDGGTESTVSTLVTFGSHGGIFPSTSIECRVEGTQTRALCVSDAQLFLLDSARVWQVPLTGPTQTVAVQTLGRLTGLGDTPGG